jgi:hypothetical protein
MRGSGPEMGCTVSEKMYSEVKHPHPGLKTGFLLEHKNQYDIMYRITTGRTAKP